MQDSVEGRSVKVDVEGLSVEDNDGGLHVEDKQKSVQRPVAHVVPRIPPKYTRPIPTPTKKKFVGAGFCHLPKVVLYGTPSVNRPFWYCTVHGVLYEHFINKYSTCTVQYTTVWKFTV